jgi:hypothetical protein
MRFPCPVCAERDTQVGTWRNAERSGKRSVTRLSTVARRVENVRHTDVDLTQWCPRCRKPQIFAEVKRSVVSDYEWDQARRHAKTYGHGCIAILVIEGIDVIGIKIYDSGTQEISDVTWGDEGSLRTVLEAARDRHECWV